MAPSKRAGIPETDAPAEELYGTWRLVSWTRQVVETGERSDIFGQAPNGFITYTRDGRMSSIVVAEDRPKPPDLAKLTDPERAMLFKSMVAMAGTFAVEGSRVLHRIDISWNENWTETTQVRNFVIEGTRLTIRTEPAPSAIDGKTAIATLIWEKVR
jgi:hypothetical protein